MRRATVYILLLIMGTPLLVYPFHVISMRAFTGLEIGYFVVAWILGRVAKERERRGPQ